MKDLLLRAPVVVRTSNMKISRRHLADYVKTLHQKACHRCSTITFLHSTNEIIDLWHCRWRCRHQILNSLLSVLHPTFWSLFSLSSVTSTNRYCLMWLLLWWSLGGLNNSIVALLTEETIVQIKLDHMKFLVFGERGKPEYQGKNLSKQSRQPTNSTYVWHQWKNWTQTMLVESKRSHHCTNPTDCVVQ